MLCTIHQKNNGHGSIRDDEPDIKIGTNTKVDWNDFSIFREIYDETLNFVYPVDKDNKAMIDADKLKSELSNDKSSNDKPSKDASTSNKSGKKKLLKSKSAKNIESKNEKGEKEDLVKLKHELKEMYIKRNSKTHSCAARVGLQKILLKSLEIMVSLVVRQVNTM